MPIFKPNVAITANASAATKRGLFIIVCLAVSGNRCYVMYGKNQLTIN